MNVSMVTANTAIRQTRHAIPSFEELKYQLNGAQNYSKFDIKHGYIRIELGTSSRTTTTFYTQKSLRRSRRLTFGMNYAAEVFNEEFQKTLPDISNVSKVYKTTPAQHNLALAQTLQRLQGCDLTLRKDKWDKVFKNGPSKICGRQPLKTLK